VTRIEQWDRLVDQTLVGRENWVELPSGPVVVVIDLGSSTAEPSGPDGES
jgi:hypothetical protein